MKSKTINGQLSFLAFLPQPPKFYEGEWLKAQGFKNIYNEAPPRPGIYEWRDIETPTKGKLLEYTGTAIILGRLAMGKFRPCWWKEVTDDKK